MNPLEKQIAPDIINDALFELLKSYAKRPGIHTILEIGAGSGEGSTTAFVTGMLENPNKDKRFMTIEISNERSTNVQRKFNQIDFIRVYTGNAIGLDGYETDERIVEFYNSQNTALNRHPVNEILKWKANEIEYITKFNVPVNRIDAVKSENGIRDFDFVLIDGSEFTGVAELRAVIGAKYIALDDINCLKNLDNYNTLKGLYSGYELKHEDWNLRNGYAIFKRIDDVTN